MKNIYILIISLTLGMNAAFAQSSLVKKADKYYDRLQYVKAAETYEKVVAKGTADNHVLLNLADAYYQIFDTKNAEKYYAKLVKSNKDPEIYFRYAQMLKANGKYKESIPWMKKFAQMKPADHRAISFREHPNSIIKILEQGKDKFVVNELPKINTEYADFGAVLFGEKLYFVSGRDTGNRDYGWDEQPFLDIYQADFVGSEVSNIEKVPGQVNTKYHDGTFCFSPFGDTMYFTRDNYHKRKYKTDTTGVSRLKLFVAELENGKWTNIKELPFNSDNYSVGHPAMSADGRKLYFSSDMPGGLGLSDLYVVDVLADGKYGTPVNLGPNINTEGRESFPFISKNGDLYFSSDGHQGLGGLDVFVCENVEGRFSRPINLGVPLNSGKDDFSIFIDDDTKEGFISSNRRATRIGDDDIYTIKNVKPICEVLISTIVVDAKTKKPMPQASVTLTDRQGNPIKTKLTDKDGHADFLIECNKDVVVEARAEGYENNKQNVSATDDEKVSVNIALNPIEKIIKVKELVINPIYFDFDKWNIRSDAAFELDKVVEAMKKYPKMNIHIASHTDSRGSYRYNQELSDKRARSTMEYIISKGIDASRLTAEGKGESEPAVQCSPCTDEEHQLNRRSEFLIVKNISN